MKLRIARKILDADLNRYRDGTLGRVHRRWAKCASAKADEAFYQEMVRLYRQREKERGVGP